MTEQLNHMMAEMESWESAAEFGIPKDLWAEYQVRKRSDDLYIAVLSAIFDALRIESGIEQQQKLSEIAKTLLIYSRSAASKYLKGVDKSLNLLYCASVFYIAGFPATATFVVKNITDTSDFSVEENFLRNFLNRKFEIESEIDSKFADFFESTNVIELDDLISDFEEWIGVGLKYDPRLFIVSKLAYESLTRFKKYNIWKCLEENAANYNFEMWKEFLENQDSFPLWELFPSQMEAIESGILSDNDKTYSMQMPTSSGKTSLCEILIYNEVNGRGKNVLFLVPFRALASEIKNGISKRLKAAGINVIASHGGNIPTSSLGASVEQADVLIITPEKYLSLVQILPEIANRFDTVICDEGHLIDDKERGLQYELLLTKLKSTEENSRKIVFISAILPNVDEIHNWLGGDANALAISDYLPVQTDFSFIVKEKNKTLSLDFNTIYEHPRSYFLKKFLIQDEFKFFNQFTQRKNLIKGYDSLSCIACAAALKTKRSGPVVIFTTTKADNGVRGLAKKFITMYEQNVNVAKNNPPKINKKANSILLEFITFLFGENYLLSQLLEHGIGFHHGDLPQEIRREMESAIKNKSISVLICTSTLAEGVNLPIRTLIVHTINRFDGVDSTVPLDKRNIKNIVGRVGRAGKETRGRIIFVNNKDREYVESVFQNNDMEPAFGALYDLVTNLNNRVIELDIQLTNEVFEKQNNKFLSTLDKIDKAIIDLIPIEVAFEEIIGHIEHIIKQTLAYHCFDTKELKSRINEVFRLRAEFIENQVQENDWSLIKASGSSPRFWNFVNDEELISRPEWKNLEEIFDEEWIENVVLRLLDRPAIEITHSTKQIENAILGWMSGDTYDEISESCTLDIDETLKLLTSSIGFELNESIKTLTQLAISNYEEEELSEFARNWSSLLQYGLGNLQQLDLFDRGATDRLAVWGISRYLNENNIDARKSRLIEHLKYNLDELHDFLLSDERVPTLCMNRIIEELDVIEFS